MPECWTEYFEYKVINRSLIGTYNSDALTVGLTAVVTGKASSAGAGALAMMVGNL